VKYGRTADRVAGTLSRLLHLRRTKHDTIRDFEQEYLDLPLERMFPRPEPIRRMKQRRSLLGRAVRTTTLSWQSDYRPICDRYRARHDGDYRVNHTAWARWLVPDGRPRRTCLIYVHGWLEPGSWVEEALLFPRWARALGVDLLHVALPFHGRRNPRGALFSGEYFWTADLVRSVEGVRQAAFDTRAAMLWLRERGYERIGVTGLSLGGSITMLLACVEPLPDFVIPLICHLELEDAVENAPILWRMKQDLERMGLGAERRRELFRRLGWSSIRPLLGPERQLWIEAEQDVYIDPELVRRQWNDWARPEILWIEGGHMTFPLQLDAITERMAAFVARVT
jgi:pimeloyl-ACP methyl ester carboxylesterase